jgi:hypothetical protein
MARMWLLEPEGVITQGCEQVMCLANDLSCHVRGPRGGPCRDRPWRKNRLANLITQPSVPTGS